MKTLVEYQGIIGAVLGVIGTLITTHLLKKWGKIHIHSGNQVFKLYRMDEWGRGNIETDSTKAEYGIIEFDLWLFNSSEEPKGLRELNIRFYDKHRNLLFSISPTDDATGRIAGGGYHRDKIVTINLPVKEMIYYKIHASFKGEAIRKSDHCAFIYFEGKDHRGKKVKSLIEKID